jgi:type VI secretion system protein ImpL
MASGTKQLVSALVIAGLVFTTGILILLVWFLSPSWVELPGKILITAFLLVLWPIGILIVYYSRRGKPSGAEAQSNGNGPAPKPSGSSHLAAPAGTYEELNRGAEEAMQWLRGTKLGNSNGADPAYALPWYLVAGPVGAGKSSLLVSAGLDFQVLPSQRASEQDLIRPTSHSDWRVTNTAVWLDTSGRYQTEGPDRDEWAGLIETLKRYRKGRPIDGFVLAINAIAVAKLSETEIEQQAKVLRARLDEAMSRAGSRFPVYLVFTHMDQLDGFAEYFASFTGEERLQVWGVTIPLSQSQNAQALFDSEFDHLYGRLVRRRTVQLATAATPDEQLRIFKFPGRFRRLRNQLGRFASAIFRPNPFSESPLLRGFYFTSTPGVGTENAKRLTGGEFFTDNLFKNVLLPDRDITAAAQATQRKPKWGRYLLLGAAMLLLAVFFLGMILSFFNNRALIADADARGRKLTEIRKATSRNNATPAQVQEELRAVESVRQILADLDDYERNSPPLTLRFGLYAGNKINSSDPSDPSILRHLYFEAIEERFLKPTITKVEQELSKFSTAAAVIGARPATTGTTDEDYLGRHYDLLKAYMMLNKSERVEPMFLAMTLRDYWQASAPVGMDDVALQQLDYFANQARKEDAPHPEIDNALVANAQDKLLAYPVVNRVYKRITGDLNAAVKYPVNLSTIPGARDGNILSSTYSVPGAFTVDGYRLMTEKLQSSAADEFRKDDWVMKAGTATDANMDVKKDELANMYYRDYVGQWQRFLQEVKVRDYESKEDAVKTLRVLSGSNSPLDSTMREVVRQTNLSQSGSGFFGWLKGLFASKTGIGASTQVEKEFKPVIEFMSGKADANAMTEYRTQLKKVDDTLSANTKALQEISKALQAGNDTIGLRAARQNINDSFEARGFNSTPASDAAAKFLKQPLDNLNTLLVGTDFAQIEKVWQTLYTRAQAIEGGFPFVDGGSDASIAAVAQFLNPQDGDLTKFFNERLKPYFEDDWTVKKEASDKFSPAFTKYLVNARKLRDALFPDNGKQPRAEYQITLAPVKDGMEKVVIDGNLVSVPDKTTANFVWPGDKSGVKITVTPLSGQDQTRAFAGEWGLLRMFAQSGGGDGKGAEFRLQPQVGTGSVQMTIQPKSGNIFQRDLFAALKAPKSVIQER